MNRLRQSIYARAFPLIMTGIFLLWIANKALFTHTHIHSSGRIITHSHPFDKPDTQNPAAPFHTHSDAYLDFSVTFDFLFPILFLALGLKLFPVIHPSSEVYNYVCITAVPEQQLCRGPPLCV